MHLTDHYNMSIHEPKIATLDGLFPSQKYLLEVNPNWLDANPADINNKIDARWLDMENGLYVDITVLRNDVNGFQDTMVCKDRHRYLRQDIFPLRESMFEGMKAKVPAKFADVLAEEYGDRSMNVTRYANHRFDKATQEWLPL